MKPLDALDSAISVGIFPGGAYPSEGIKYYLRTGREIPELMLPGGIVKRASPEIREALKQLTSKQTGNVPDWVIKQYVG
jgi:hypothetical protein